MQYINTEILLRELDRRLYNFRHGEFDTFFSVMSEIDEPSLVELDNALTTVIESKTEYTLKNLLETDHD